MCLNASVIILELAKKTLFKQESMCRTLTKAASIKNLYSIVKYNVNSHQVNRDATIEYNRLQEQNRCDLVSSMDVGSRRLTIPLLNIKYLRRHKTLVKADRLCLTKSQICANDDTSDIRRKVRTFAIDFNSCGRDLRILHFV